jgi:hypothetical protein
MGYGILRYHTVVHAHPMHVANDGFDALVVGIVGKQHARVLHQRGDVRGFAGRGSAHVLWNGKKML